MKASNAARGRGFTLIEILVSMVVITLILGSILVPLNTQVGQRKIAEAQKALDQINDALVGFALSQTPPRLPCPDTTGDGIEDVCPFAPTTSTGGNVPWATLGVPATDPWGQRYRYRVNGAYTTTQTDGPPYLSLTTVPLGTCTLPGGNVGIIKICADNACATTLANGVPAVIYSLGANGAQVPASPDEVENTDNDCFFVSRTYSAIAGAEFDDIVTWIAGPILLNRLVTAQKLP